MDVLTPVATGILLAFFTAIQVWINKGRFDALERRIDNHDRRFDQLSSEISAVRSELGSEISAVRSELGSEIAAVRSDLTQIALEIGRRPQAG